MPPPAYAVERRNEPKDEGGLLSFLMCGDCCSPQASSNKPPNYYSLQHGGNRNMSALPVSGVKLRHPTTGAEVQEYRRREMEDERQLGKSPRGVASQYTAVGVYQQPSMTPSGGSSSYRSPTQMYQQPINGTSTSGAQTYTGRSPRGIEPKQARGGFDLFNSRPSDWPSTESPGAVNPISWQQRTNNAVAAQKSDPEVVTLTPEALRQRRAEERRMELERMSAEEAANSLSPEELRRRRAEQSQQMELERMRAEEAANSLSPEELRRRRAEQHRQTELERMRAEEAANSLSPDELRRQRAEERLRVLKNAEQTLKTLTPDGRQRERQTVDMHNVDRLSSPRMGVPGTIVNSSTQGPIQRIAGEVSPIRNPEPQVIERKYPGISSSMSPDEAPQYGAPGSIINASNRSPTQLFQSPAQPARSSQSPPPAATRAAQPPPAATATDSTPGAPMSMQTEALRQAMAQTSVSSSNGSPSQLFQASAAQTEPRRLVSPSSTQTDSLPMAPSAYLASLGASSQSPGQSSQAPLRGDPPQFIQTGTGTDRSAVSNATRAPAQMYQQPSISPRPEPSKYGAPLNSINSSNRSPTQLFSLPASTSTQSPSSRPQAEGRRNVEDDTRYRPQVTSPRSQVQSPPIRPQAEERRPVQDDTHARPEVLSPRSQGIILGASNRSPTQLFQASTSPQPKAPVSTGSGSRSLAEPPSVESTQASSPGPVLPSREFNVSYDGASPRLSRESSEEEYDSRASPRTVVLEIESCVMLPCCKSKVPRNKVIKTINETEMCPCCGTQGINHTMLLPINPSAITDSTALVLPCCHSQVPKKHAEKMLANTSNCPVCFESNIFIKDLQILDPVEVTVSKDTLKFDLDDTPEALLRATSSGSVGTKKKKVKKKTGSFKNKKSASSVYSGVGPGVKFFTDQEIEQMTAAQKQAIREARRKSVEAGGPEDGWDQMSLNFVSELLMADAKKKGNANQDQHVEDITIQNPLWAFQSGGVDAGPPPSFSDRQASFNHTHSNDSSGHVTPFHREPSTPQYTRETSFSRNFMLAGSGGSGKIRSYNEVKEEEEKKRSPGESKKQEEEPESWMDTGLSFVSDLLNSEAKQKASPR